MVGMAEENCVTVFELNPVPLTTEKQYLVLVQTSNGYCSQIYKKPVELFNYLSGLGITLNNDLEGVTEEAPTMAFKNRCFTLNQLNKRDLTLLWRLCLKC